MGRFGKLLVILVLAAGAFVAYRMLLSGPTVHVVQPVRGPAVEAVYATGTVEPVYWSKLSAPDGGRIIEILKDQGDSVRKGDIIARLDAREERAEIDRLHAEEARLKVEVNRQKGLLRSGFTTRQRYDAVMSEYNQIRAALDAARKRLSDMQIVAPMDGQVLRRAADAGDVVKAGDVIFWVGQPAPLRMFAEVDEEDIPKAFVGQKALIKADAYANRVIQATVTKVIPKGDPVRKIFLVELGLPADSGLYIGMTSEVNLVVREKANTLLVPITAVNDGTVWVAAGGRAVPKKVQVGIVGDKMVEITGGIGPDARIVNPVPAGLEAGARVKVAG